MNRLRANKMQHFNEPLPLPFLKLDKEGNIIYYSTLALEHFDLQEDNIKSIVDEESYEKLLKYSSDHQTRELQMELVFKSRKTPLALYEVHMVWDDDLYANMLLVPKDGSNQLLVEKMAALQQRLASTDFELYEQREELEQILTRLHELSGPFIPLTDKMSLIPLFGDITEKKIHIISQSCLQSVFSGEYEDILIDFTAVGEVEVKGMEKFVLLLKTLHLMTGKKIKIIGIKPNTAKVLNQFSLDGCMEFDHSLKQVLYRYFRKE
ncbi:Stressosome protein rsbRB [Jeotgalibacillus sp. ET6]|uniref:Stressosome protein rsbRB n=1 Tax=Jeotgalibacillus sp. ET6 TaxID=3037260 RepID=UPI0024189BEE|nr:Stressosome protein rsbRB [Jeotgalibacillus sp. ET6]MDG5472384.1 Stressosome protein rsbRB [Jeotgalibacillus sp. ET6]